MPSAQCSVEQVNTRRRRVNFVSLSIGHPITFVPALSWLGRLAHLGQWSEAANQYGELCRRVPSDAGAHMGLGHSLQKLERHEEATAAYERAIQLNPRDVLAYYNVAESYIAEGRLQDALVAYRRVVNITPDDVEAIGNLGATLGRLGHWAEAAECHRKAHALKGELTSAYNLGVALTELHEFEHAETAFRDALTFEPDSIELKVRLALSPDGQGRSDDAVRLPQEASEGDPPDPTALAALADALLRTDRVEDALATARRALPINPAAASIWAIVGAAFLRANRPSEALDSFEHALKLTPGQIDYLAWRGAALSALNRHAEASRTFDEVRAMDPEYLDQREELARYSRHTRRQHQT